jgi:beta-fructofuranosidase
VLRHPGNLIGDAWFHVHGDMVHVFYLTCPAHIPRHTLWDIGHATSTDLVHWQRHDPALVRGLQGSWDDTLATGSVLAWNSRFWMAYSAGRTAQVGMAVSDDLETWDKLPANPVTSVDTRYYEAEGSGVRRLRHWRDPFLFAHEGWVYHCVCASRNDGPTDARGTLGLARTRNMSDWEVLPPPDVEPVAQELECPQVHNIGGKYYLLFSSATEWFSQPFLARHASQELGWATYSMVGPTPFGPFRIHGTGRILPVSYPVQPYACQLVVLGRRAFLLGTFQLPDGDAVCDPIPVAVTEDGLRLEGRCS